MMGTPQAMAVALAASLSPIWARMWEGGPMNLMPAASQAAAKAAFSERKPYPGWMASQPVARATVRMASTLR